MEEGSGAYTHTHTRRMEDTHSETGKKEMNVGERWISLNPPERFSCLFLREEGGLDHDVANLVRVRVRGRATVLKVSLAGDGDGLGDTDRGTARVQSGKASQANGNRESVGRRKRGEGHTRGGRHRTRTGQCGQSRDDQ